jgi:hypothetical protein
MMPLVFISLSNLSDVRMYTIVQRTSTLSNMPNVFVLIVLEVYIKSILKTSLTKAILLNLMDPWITNLNKFVSIYLLDLE